MSSPSVSRSKTVISAFNVLPTEIKENFVTGNSSYEPKNMKLEIAASRNEGIMEFCYVYCKVCQKKADGIMQNCGDKLLEHAKIENLMNNWDILGIFCEIINLVECVIQDGIKHKDIYIGLDARKYLTRQYKHVGKFHKEK